MDELNPMDEDLKSLTPDEDSEDEDLQFLDELEDEPEESKEDAGVEALKALNAELKKRGLNKNYKSWDDVAKSEKQRDIDFAKKGMEQPKEEVKKEVVVEKLPINLSERLLKVEQPDSVFVLEDIKQSHPNQDPYEVWNSSEYYRKEAAVRSENERNKTRLANPSGDTEGKSEVDPIEAKFLNNLPDKYKSKK